MRAAVARRLEAKAVLVAGERGRRARRRVGGLREEAQAHPSPSPSPHPSPHPSPKSQALLKYPDPDPNPSPSPNPKPAPAPDPDPDPDREPEPDREPDPEQAEEQSALARQYSVLIEGVRARAAEQAGWRRDAAATAVQAFL